jgi:hypothetical protein
MHDLPPFHLPFFYVPCFYFTFHLQFVIYRVEYIVCSLASRASGWLGSAGKLTISFLGDDGCDSRVTNLLEKRSP